MRILRGLPLAVTLMTAVVAIAVGLTMFVEWMTGPGNTVKGIMGILAGATIILAYAFGEKQKKDNRNKAEITVDGWKDGETS